LGAYGREVDFYIQFGSRFGNAIPTSHFSAINDEGFFTLILEISKGQSMPIE
jgi:hypothetical protein